MVTLFQRSFCCGTVKHGGFLGRMFALGYILIQIHRNTFRSVQLRRATPMMPHHSDVGTQTAGSANFKNRAVLLWCSGWPSFNSRSFPTIIINLRRSCRCPSPTSKHAGVSSNAKEKDGHNLLTHAHNMQPSQNVVKRQVMFMIRPYWKIEDWRSHSLAIVRIDVHSVRQVD